MRRVAGALLVLLASWGAVASSSSSPSSTSSPSSSPSSPSSSMLTPDAAVARALDRSDEMRAAWLGVEIARVEDTAFVLDAPQLQLGHRSLNAVGDQVDPFDDSQVGVSWRLPGLEDLGLNQTIGAWSADANVLKDVDDVAEAVAVEVRLLHVRVLSVRDEVALAQERVALLEKVADLQARRVAVQVATALDTGLTSLELLAARADVADLSGDLVRAEQRLGRLLGEKLPLALAPPSAPLCALPAEPFDAVVVAARQRSSRLRAIALEEEGLRLREARAWLRYVPWVDSVQVGSIQQGTTPELRARLDIAIPLFEPLSPELRVVGLERERLAAERRAIERDIEERLGAALDQLAGFVKMVEVYAASTKDVDDQQDLVARSLAAEVVDTLRVATVQERILQARRQALRSQFKCDEAGVAFMQAAGTVLPPSSSAASDVSAPTD
jgi:outer membrane protein TolC